ncbi:MAG TPA: sulfurtransferase [Mycobacteriales bacterium]|nr:sulfurtransferase [Mycobacteriales bacterium]
MSTSTNPLISVPDLRAAHAAGAAPTLIDVRWDPAGPAPVEEYRAGHLPGAVFADLDTDLAAPAGTGGRHPLPTGAAFQAAARRLGVRRERPVVVYDRGDATIAARLWWMLRYFGHPDTRVLDGGYRAWVRAGLPTATGDEPAGQVGDVTCVPGGLPLVTAGEIPELARHGVLLDARAGQRFRGESEPLDPVAGHIPGAVSAPTTDNNDGEGLFRTPQELRERFTGLGVGPGTAVAAYCGSGVTAAHEVLALGLAGFTAALYPGSWSEWITDPTRPVATGAG